MFAAASLTGSRVARLTENGIRGLQGHRAAHQGAPACGIGQTAHQEAVPGRENAGRDTQQSEPARAETGRDHGDRT